MELGLSSDEITSKSELVSMASPDHTAPATPAALADVKPAAKAKPADDGLALDRLVHKDALRRAPSKVLPPLDPIAEMAEDMSKTLEARPRPLRPIVLDAKETPLATLTPMPRKRRRRRSGPQTIDLMLPKKDETAPARDDEDGAPAPAAPASSFGASLVDRRARPSLKLPVTAIAVVLAFVLLIFLLTRV
jgi:hypothetical protein